MAEVITFKPPKYSIDRKAYFNSKSPADIKKTLSTSHSKGLDASNA